MVELDQTQSFLRFTNDRTSRDIMDLFHEVYNVMLDQVKGLQYSSTRRIQIDRIGPKYYWDVIASPVEEHVANPISDILRSGLKEETDIDISRP